MHKVFCRKCDAKATVEDVTVAVEGLIPVEDVAVGRRPYGIPHAVIGAQGRVYTPMGLFSQALGQHTLMEGFDAEMAQIPLGDDDPAGGGGDGAEPDEAAIRAGKKERQWQKWSGDIIPALLKPYMGLLRQTSGLREMEGVHKEKGCTGCTNGRLLEVSCVFFERLEKTVLCTCTEPALQLLSHGLFPCAPSEPSLAVELNVLDFARELFVNAAPNTTAWCDTLEGFLSARNFKLQTQNSLRGRFGNALHWYATLTDTKNVMIRNYLDYVRGAALSMDDEDAAADENISYHPEHLPDVVMSSPNDSPGHSNSSNHADSQHGIPKLDRPSDYLRERCPLCFGGDNWRKPEEMVDAIVCIDACFTQKRRKSESKAWTAPRAHPDTVFVSKQDVDAMEAEVEEIRPSTKGKKPKNAPPKSGVQQGSSTDAKDSDDYEPGMRIPSSVLDGCNESFVAADEKRVKASTLFFADTGLMAMLCRHDRVLWLVNMTSAGEKQHYALSLLTKLFEHIPGTMQMGVLYDIGCQLHRSCEKFDFLGEFRDRIVFAISVFHAYGHQWPCQIIYHPRKCKGFGLTDGEGCERFWSLIKSLIPSCRVSGYYNRIYTIDTQVKHLDEKSLMGLGGWLKHKWITTSAKKSDATDTLEMVYSLGFDEKTLRLEWDQQVIEQTKPLKRQSKSLANKEIQEILTLTKNLELYKTQITEFEEMIESGVYDEGIDAMVAEENMEELRSKSKKAQKAINHKKTKLSVDGRLNLTKLMGNEFLRVRMNALALKQRIRDRLRNRKFELESLERAYRTTVNQIKLQKHADRQLKRQEPGIQTLARNYNKLCAQMLEMIEKGKAPRGARAPLAIEQDGLFKLDVDDDIWQDIGLIDENDDDVAIPAWLGDDNVRTGIKALLEHDRCVEEEHRLKAEKLSMQQWMREEWAVLDAALAWSQDDSDIIYQLLERKKHLIRLCLSWRPAVRVIPQVIEDSWGPSLEELDNAQNLEYTESVMKNAQDESHRDEVEVEIETYETDEDEDINDAELVDNLENIGLMNDY